jgi:hypothetical protein
MRLFVDILPELPEVCPNILKSTEAILDDLNTILLRRLSRFHIYQWFCSLIDEI